MALAILTGFFTALGVAASVGTTPSSLNIGEVEPGETIEQTFYITTSYQEEFILEPSFSNGATNRRFRDETKSDETSEKDISDWVELTEEVEVNPNTSEEVEVEDGSVNSEASFDMVINVPNDAEPGYHHGRIRLNPDLESSPSGAGTVNWGETIPRFEFYVQGHAERDIDILDVEGIRIGEDRVQIIKQLQNSGTVTTRLDSSEVDVVRNGDNVGTITVSSAKFAPGEVAEVESIWRTSDLEGGNYQVEGLVDYRTGETHLSDDFSITDIIRDPVDIDEPEAETEDDADIPYTLLLIVLLFLGVILYLLEVDLVWTIVFVGVTGISLFILFSSAPSYLILILAAIIGVTLYYGI